MNTIGDWVGVFAIALSLVAIYFSWQFYREGTRVLIDILKSSKTTETQTSQTIPQLVGIIESQFKDSVNRHVRSTSSGLSDIAVKEALSELRTTLLNDVSKIVTPLLKVPSLPPEASLPVTERPPLLSVPEKYRGYDWQGLIRTIDKEEGTDKFVGLARFIREALQNESQAREALQYAIDNGMVSTYRVPNPGNPDFPTTAIKLVRTHPLVIMGLQKRGRHTIIRGFFETAEQGL